jgi:hypothetical protein
MNKESFVMSFGDCFMMIGLMFYIGAFLLVFTRKPQTAASAAGAH